MSRFYIDPPPHFRGMSQDKPILCHQRNLPHWRQEGATYFVTFRLSDSIPKDKAEALRVERAQWLKSFPPPHHPAQMAEYSKLFSARVEKWLDAGWGSCCLAARENGLMIRDALECFDGDRYDLFSWVVMANHVHCVVRPREGNDLDAIWASWKGFSANRLAKSGVRFRPIWFRECYDRIVRDTGHLYRIVRYIWRNPEKAGAKVETSLAGIHPDWDSSIWGREAMTAD